MYDSCSDFSNRPFFADDLCCRLFCTPQTQGGACRESDRERQGGCRRFYSRKEGVAEEEEERVEEERGRKEGHEEGHLKNSFIPFRGMVGVHVEH